MARRDILPADDTAAHRAWIAAALMAEFQTPRKLPSLRMPKVQPEPLPDLFRDLVVEAEPAPAPDPVGTPIDVLLRAHFGDALPPQSPLTLKRRELRRQRAEAAALKADAEVEPEPVVPVAEPAPAEDAMARLVASGITNEFLAGLGALRDPDSPYTPRSIAFPVTLHRVGGRFQPSTAPRIWELHLSTPACGGLPFVRRVEEVTGLKARWVHDTDSRGMCGQWHHAADLANDAGWERLASSMEHTTLDGVARAAGMHVGDGSLSAANARRLLNAIGFAEPETRSCPNLCPHSDGGMQTSLVGWEAIHAVEDGLIVPGNPKRGTYARVTVAGWRSVGKEPPAPKPATPKKSKTGPLAEDVAYVIDAIQAILPKGVPTYVKEVLSVGRVPRSKTRRIVEIVLWDGGIGRMEISGEPGAHGYHWKTAGGDGRPFHWDEAEQAWVRIDEPEAA